MGVLVGATAVTVVSWLQDERRADAPDRLTEKLDAQLQILESRTADLASNSSAKRSTKSA